MSAESWKAMSWVSRLKFLGGGVAGTCAVFGAILPAIKDYYSEQGKQKERSEIVIRLETIGQSVPAEQRPAAQLLVRSFTANIEDKDKKNSTSSIQEQADQLAGTIRSVSERRYVPQQSDSPVFELSAGQTALICQGKHTVTFKGPKPSLAGKYDLMVNGRNWIATAGERFSSGRNGPGLTVMEIESQKVRLLSACS